VRRQYFLLQHKHDGGGKSTGQKKKPVTARRRALMILTIRGLLLDFEILEETDFLGQFRKFGCDIKALLGIECQRFG
jgi:hypothetical protein